MNGGGGYRLFHIPGHQLLTCWAGACPFLSHKLQGHSQQPACGSPGCRLQPSLLSLCWPQEYVLIWQDLSLAVPSQKASTDLWGVYGAAGNFSKRSVLSWSVCCLSPAWQWRASASLPSALWPGGGSAPQLEAARSCPGHPGADTGSVHPRLCTRPR